MLAPASLRTVRKPEPLTLVARVALARPVELFRLSDVAATFDHGSPDKNAVKEKAFRAIL